MEKNTTKVVGTAVLGALVIVFDYTLKFSGLKIPFPWYTQLKFDFSGIPIVLSLILYGLTAGATTSSIAFLGILLRSGNLIGPSMKAIAEFSTIVGMAAFINRANKLGKYISIASGLIVRIVVMNIFNVVMLPLVYPTSYPTIVEAFLFIPFLSVFNLIAGSISIFGGLIIHKALIKQIPSLMRNREQTIDLRG